MPRTTAEVFADHLARRSDGDVEGDLALNMARDCVLLTSYGRFEGHAGVRAAKELLAHKIPHARYRYIRRSVHGDVAFLEWTATGDGAVVRDGADSFLIRDGRVQVMTIHFTVDRTTLGAPLGTSMAAPLGT